MWRGIFTGLCDRATGRLGATAAGAMLCWLESNRRAHCIRCSLKSVTRRDLHRVNWSSLMPMKAISGNLASFRRRLGNAAVVRAAQQRIQTPRRYRRHLPKEAAIVRPIGAVLLEQNDELPVQRRYFKIEIRVELLAPTNAADPARSDAQHSQHRAIHCTDMVGADFVTSPRR